MPAPAAWIHGQNPDKHPDKTGRRTRPGRLAAPVTGSPLARAPGRRRRARPHPRGLATAHHAVAVTLAREYDRAAAAGLAQTAAVCPALGLDLDTARCCSSSSVPGPGPFCGQLASPAKSFSLSSTCT